MQAQRQYLCTDCGAQARKPPLKAVPGWRGASITDFGGLGKWRCTIEKKRCKVRVVIGA
jgi:hypothetical protein